MPPISLFAATGDAVARITCTDDRRFETRLGLAGSGAQCVAADPAEPGRAFAGTFDDGVYRTLDGGATWAQVGDGIPHKRALSVAISPCHRANGRAVVYVGTEPTSLYRSEDDGQTWQALPRLTALPSAPTWSFPPRPHTSHIRWIALHHRDPQVIFVGIELGGVMRSLDGGATWEDRKPCSYHDAHALATHPVAVGCVYEAAGGGVARSDDAGRSWAQVDGGMDRHYAWGLAVDPADPNLWYVSASYGPRNAHDRRGDAQGIVFRKRGDAPWQPLGGDGAGLPRPLASMPYVLLVPRERPGALLVGTQHGELWLSDDQGDRWRRLDGQLPALLALSEA